VTVRRRIYRPSEQFPSSTATGPRPEVSTPTLTPPRDPRSIRIKLPRIDPITGLALAITAGALAALTPPPPGETAAAGLAGLIRLGLYAAAAGLLVCSGPSIAPLEGRFLDVAPQRKPASATLILAAGLVTALGVATWNAGRLRERLDDSVGPAIWLVSMLLVVVATLLPLVWSRDRSSRVSKTWTLDGENLGAARSWRGRWFLLLAIVGFAALLRLPALGTIPIGIQADEGDRAYTALRVIYGLGPRSWFDHGWYYISEVYFHVLAAAMTVLERAWPGHGR